MTDIKIKKTPYFFLTIRQSDLSYRSREQKSFLVLIKKKIRCSVDKGYHGLFNGSQFTACYIVPLTGVYIRQNTMMLGGVVKV